MVVNNIRDNYVYEVEQERNALKAQLAEAVIERDMWRGKLSLKVSQLDDVMNERDAALAMLRELEWLELEPITPTPGHGECPVCFEDASNNHAPDCRLAKILEGEE